MSGANKIRVEIRTLPVIQIHSPNAPIRVPRQEEEIIPEVNPQAEVLQEVTPENPREETVRLLTPQEVHDPVAIHPLTLQEDHHPEAVRPPVVVDREAAVSAVAGVVEDKNVNFPLQNSR